MSSNFLNLRVGVSVSVLHSGGSVMSLVWVFLCYFGSFFRFLCSLLSCCIWVVPLGMVPNLSVVEHNGYAKGKNKSNILSNDQKSTENEDSRARTSPQSEN